MTMNAKDDMPQVITEDFHRRGFRTLYETQVGRDFLLVSSDGLEMSVHSAVLIAASPVFLAMFEGDFAERQTGRCVMTQVDAPVLKVLVQFMYCGSCQTGVSDHTEQIIVVADQYQLTDLVGQCEQILIKKMTEENVTDLLLLTDSIEAPSLKAHALRCVRKNSTVLKESGAIKKLYENASAKLLSELVSYLLP